jgi:hypothetical protein
MQAITNPIQIVKPGVLGSELVTTIETVGLHFIRVD